MFFAFVSRVSFSLFFGGLLFFFQDSCPSVLYYPNFSIQNEVCVGVIFKNFISIKNFIFHFSIFVFHSLEKNNPEIATCANACLNASSVKIMF